MKTVEKTKLIILPQNPTDEDVGGLVGVTKPYQISHVDH